LRRKCPIIGQKGEKRNQNKKYNKDPLDEPFFILGIFFVGFFILLEKRRLCDGWDGILRIK